MFGQSGKVRAGVLRRKTSGTKRPKVRVGDGVGRCPDAIQWFSSMAVGPSYCPFGGDFFMGVLIVVVQTRVNAEQAPKTPMWELSGEADESKSWRQQYLPHEPGRWFPNVGHGLPR